MENGRFPPSQASLLIAVAILAANFCGPEVQGGDPEALSQSSSSEDRLRLTSEQWQRLQAGVDRGLEYLAKNQHEDGSFDAPHQAQPGVTGLCVLAFLSRGHLAGEGVYGDAINHAIKFVLRTQQPSGLFFSLPVNNRIWSDQRHKGAAYNHAMAGLMLTEAHGMSCVANPDRMEEAIRNAIRFTLELQRRPKPPIDEGGWRYVVMEPEMVNHSDLSVTAWQIMFLRSARNAEFDVSVESIDAALAFIRRTYISESGVFPYGHHKHQSQVTRATVGSGILLLSLGGEHHSEIARSAGTWILKHPFDRYNQVGHHAERYHYSAYYCSQAMFQLGGEFWSEFYPHFMTTLLANQGQRGNWEPEGNSDHWVGDAYTTALSILALTPAFQLLPIYQR